jgi:hypothetical protein
VAFLAMSLHELGRHDEAHAALERLHQLMIQERWATNWEATFFLREAELLILGLPDSNRAAEIERIPTR